MAVTAKLRIATTATKLFLAKYFTMNLLEHRARHGGIRLHRARNTLILSLFRPSRASCDVNETLKKCK